ncbi:MULTISPECIES: 6-phosphofructokinase [Anaerotruncus]|uniref:ATP-dependent 6-phosphofructokinase n=1 Tax=Anaerotruncus colihominis TaxID=169435 RepID=A0A845RHE0_9FIRM|nr:MULTISPECIES: 6-phosphofructokinase [Anaerotruncus]MCI8492762.1 6-phosphofructokinase [Anaerotruncus sp.]MCR2025864.1 6-phosphofructokinase [Anaerotruncus colihominis]NBI78979.1 6-phosphofructokinase [Anaerotruncus colihominis]NDO38584.1 6-phosphofructokinase [Anaerotruncus colihominis]
MEFKQKTIGVLSSGGDAPGMNAAIRSVVRTALNRNIRVLGIRRGYSGLLARDMFEMNLRSVSDTLHRGGTILYSARCPEFRDDKGVERGKEVCREMGIDGLVVIGGDGSFRGARDLSLKGIPCIGIPGTIDNDIASSDYTVGFDTAVNTVMDMVDKLRDTSQSHDRCSIVEVMGRHCGDIALHAGIACGAVAILVPEVPFSIDAIIEKMQRTLRTGKKHFIIIVAEGVTSVGGVGTVHDIAEEIEARTGVESRATVLGHVQRGGAPSARERVLASEMGYHAVELLEQGIGNRVVVNHDNKIVDYDILEALQMKKQFDRHLYDIADAISI